LDCRELRARLGEAEETVRAITEGAADAIVVSGSQGKRVFASAGADQYYRTLVETMKEGMVTLLPGSVIGYSNRAFAELVRTPLEQVVGSSFTRFLPAEQAPALASLLERSGDSHRRGEFTLRTGDGSLVPAQLSAQQPEGNPLCGFCLAITDLTEQKKREQMQAHLAAIVESSDDAIISKTLDGIIVSWNRGAERLYGYTSEEVIGRSISLLAPIGRADEVADLLDRSKRQEAVEHYETVRVRKDGREVLVSLSISPIKDPAGSLIGASVIAHDITDRKKAEEALARRTEELARSNAELEQFAYVVSHDLQEPLRTVANFAQLLLKRYRGKLDAKADDFIDFIVDGVTRMQGMINDLLAYSRVESRGKESVPADCAELLGQALGNLQAAIEESGAQVTHDPLPVVRCDGAQILQVFQNLVGNSIKFRNGPPPRIHVGVERAAAEWVFSVKDNGIGIDSQYAGRIFEIFQRLHTQREYPGSGIGLAIAKKIVERHGGRIWVESRPQQGATFFFTLPVSGGRDAPHAGRFELTDSGRKVPGGVINIVPELSLAADHSTPVAQRVIAGGLRQARKRSEVVS
jgi:PAS domain S-box-containing protein